jgi:FkbM family methyltransferase
VELTTLAVLYQGDNVIPNCELVKVDGTQFLVFKGQDLISNHLKQELYENDIHQLALKLLINKSSGTVLDIGANLGTFCVPLARKIPKLKFHAFEPQRIVNYQLCANVVINSLENVYTYEFALSNKEEDVKLAMPDYTKETNIGAFSIDKEVRENGYECSTVNTTDKIQLLPLDLLAFSDVKIIKIDVEGHELEVLQGGLETIKANNYPPIIFEAWDWKPWFQPKRKALFEYLEGHGYKIQQLSNNNLATHESHK